LRDGLCDERKIFFGMLKMEPLPKAWEPNFSFLLKLMPPRKAYFCISLIALTTKAISF
jgi:hypothetical protein